MKVVRHYEMLTILNAEIEEPIVPPFYGNSGNGADIYSCLNYG